MSQFPVRVNWIYWTGFILLALVLFKTPAHANSSILSESDTRLYQDIFALQEQADFVKADKKIKQVSNDLLMGYIFYHRFFAKGYWTKQKEITDWLQKYKDLPVAADVYALGKQKKASLSTARPQSVFGAKSGTCSSVVKQDPIDLIQGLSFSYLSGTKKEKAQKTMRQIASYINRGKTLNAKRLIEDKQTISLFSKTDLDRAKTALAFSYFLDGMDDKALEQTAATIKRSGNQIPLAYWTAGLSYWRQGNFAAAEENFKQAANHRYAKELTRAAAAFWTARTLLKQGKYKEVGSYLEQATAYPRTFYGLLGMRALGQDLEHVWDAPQAETDDITGDFSHPALERFYALKQIGKPDWADKELAQLYFSADAEGKSILTLISQQNGFDNELLQVCGIVSTPDGTMRYPAPNWTPLNGWQLDKALVYAFVRQESCFNARAKSKAGAIGLMQIMPDTGKELARRLNYQWNETAAKEPAFNLALGQSYLQQLMRLPAVQNNLIYMAVAYNAGPGNLIKWKKQMNYPDDPLLFIESIPSKETRTFVERIIVNYWIYGALMGGDLSSLDQTIAGHFPIYTPKTE